MRLTNKLIGFDALHARVDLLRTPTYALTAGTALLWAAIGNHGGSLVVACGIALAFVAIVRLSMSRLGTSRLSALSVSVALLALCWQVSVDRLAELTVLGVVVLVCAEYFKERTKVWAGLAGAAVGLIAAGSDAKGPLILCLFLGAIWLRVAWNAVIERLSKKHFVLFAAKGLLAMILAIGVFLAANPYVHFTWVASDYAALPSLGWGYWAVIGLIAARGMWATLLLETERSPLCRGLRMYFVALGLVVAGATAVLRALGTDVFSARFFAKLQSIGLTNYSVEIAIFAVYAGMLLITAGIDRSLYKNTGFAKRVRQVL